jgi:hypothetical protein
VRDNCLSNDLPGQIVAEFATDPFSRRIAESPGHRDERMMPSAIGVVAS